VNAAFFRKSDIPASKDKICHFLMATGKFYNTGEKIKTIKLGKSANAVPSSGDSGDQSG
jgi:hypothetical protein